MPATYARAPIAREIARELIPQYHKHLDRPEVRIEFLFTSETPLRNGKPVLSCARRVGSLQAFLAGQEPVDDTQDSKGMVPLFVVTIAARPWEHMSDDQRRALVDHELCHLDVYRSLSDDELKFAIKPHDIEEFAAVVQRNGYWQDDVQRFMETAGQGRLPLETA